MSDVTDDHPYSPALRAGEMVFVSGALSVTEGGTTVEGRHESVEAARATFQRRLATVGLDVRHVASLTYYVTDVSLRDEANVDFAQAFARPRPARTFVEVSSLPYGCSVEIAGVAVTRTLRPGVDEELAR